MTADGDGDLEPENVVLGLEVWRYDADYGVKTRFRFSTGEEGVCSSELGEA